MGLLIIAFVLLTVGAEVPSVPNLQDYFNSAVNGEAVRAIKASGAKWETYEPGENPLRHFTDAQLKYVMSMPGIDYEGYMKEMQSLAGKFNNAFPKANDGGNVRAGVNDPLKAFNFPASYDYRTGTDGQRCKSTIFAQGACGGCYAFATATVVSVRACIASGASSVVELSQQNILACNKRTKACDGGILDISFNYAEEYGIVPVACQPYAESSTPDTQAYTSQKCSMSCTGSGAYTRTFCKKGTSIILNGRDRIKNEIFVRGPVASSMVVWTDLASYKSGIYKQSTGTKQGGHAIVLVGWGVEGSTTFWIVQNSWGADWGDAGYFKIDMEDANSEIGKMAYYCVPDV
jgi:cathepsin B